MKLIFKNLCSFFPIEILGFIVRREDLSSIKGFYITAYLASIICWGCENAIAG